MNIASRLSVTILLIAFVCSAALVATADEPVADTSAAKQESTLPDRFLQLGDVVCSGAEPGGEGDFAGLAARGIKTIVSVDGVRPDVETAARYGLRYVHIPFGYDAIDAHSLASLTRVAREGDQPIFVHCHHGKHRGPSAAAVIALARADIHRQEAADFLKRAGTSRDYAGLWRSVEGFVSPPADAELPELVAVAKVDALTDWMARIGRTYEELQTLQERQWRADTSQPATVPREQAKLLQEAFSESVRAVNADSDAGAESVDLRDQLIVSASLAEQLFESLRANDHAKATRSLQAIKQACSKCHADHRN